MSLVDYCQTAKQSKYAKAYAEEGSESKAGVKLGVTREQIHSVLKHPRKRQRIATAQAQQGWSPQHDMTHPVPDPFTLKRHSRNYIEGELKQEWVISEPEKAKQAEAMKQFIDGLVEDMPRKEPLEIPEDVTHDPDLLTGIFIGDAHIGSRSFAKETRHSDFSTDIAVQQLMDAVDYLVEKAPSGETGMLVDVGDAMHANGNSATTFKGTPVDTDGPQYDTMKATGMVMRYMIDRMLEKFKKVVVVVAKGNHNTDPAEGIQLMLDFFYENEPRVNVLPSNGFYHYMEFGKWLFGVHHGDKQKAEALAGSMARDMPKAWGRTTHRLWCTGHYHKDALKTLPGVKHKIFGALPPPDSWHGSMGFMGDGEMESITFKRSGGIKCSNMFNIPQPCVEPDVVI